MANYAKHTDNRNLSEVHLNVGQRFTSLHSNVWETLQFSFDTVSSVCLDVAICSNYILLYVSNWADDKVRLSNLRLNK